MRAGDDSTRTQGTTFLWVEGYGRLVSRAATASGAARDTMFALAVLGLAHGAAYFIGLERFWF